MWKVKSKPHGKYRIHPDKVAEKFGVDRRTIFRWIAKGFLDADLGQVNRKQVEELLAIWKSTYSRHKARKILNVRAVTITSWVNKGILRAEPLFGAERISKKSVSKILSSPDYRPKAKKVLLHSKSKFK